MSRILEEQKVAGRYTKALFESAVSAGCVDNVNKDLSSLADVLDSVPNLQVFFANPAIPYDEKSSFADVQLSKGMNELTKNLISLLVENNRIGILPMVIQQFEKYQCKQNNIASAEVVTASQLESKLEGKLKKLLQSMFGYADVNIENRVDPGILGGVIIKLNDQVIDGSFVGRLEKIRQEIS